MMLLAAFKHLFFQKSDNLGGRNNSTHIGLKYIKHGSIQDFVMLLQRTAYRPWRVPSDTDVILKANKRKHFSIYLVFPSQSCLRVVIEKVDKFSFWKYHSQ